MTGVEMENFYEQDKNNYNIKNNKELLKCLKESINNGYHCFMDINDLQQLIDNITTWYEIKYPERELEFYEGTRYFDFQNILPLSNHMNIEQLLYRLPHDQLVLMECFYRAKSGYHHVCNDNNKRFCINMIGMSIYKKGDLGSCYTSQFLLGAEETTGKVEIDLDLEDYINTDSINLEELLELFKSKYRDILDFKELEECIYDHNCDINLRNKILQLVALKLVYSSNTIPERGYIRATRFIDEFNNKLNLKLSKDEIDEIMKKDYKDTKLEEIKEEKQKRKIMLLKKNKK